MEIHEVEELMKNTNVKATDITEAIKATEEWQNERVDVSQVRLLRMNILEVYKSAREGLLGHIISDILTNHDDGMNGLKEDLTNRVDKLLEARNTLRKAQEDYDRAYEKIPHNNPEVIHPIDNSQQSI